jgi:hypothetical protein
VFWWGGFVYGANFADWVSRRGGTVRGQPPHNDLGWIRADRREFCPKNRYNTTLLQKFSGVTTRFRFNVL